MIDPLDIVRAVSTLTAATVVGCGVLNWYTRDAHATKGGAIWRTRAATLIFAAAGIGVVANILGAIGASAAAAAAADSHAFSFSGPLLEAYLTQTGVGHITILQFGSAVLACLLAGLAWVMLKKTPASDLLLLSAAVAAGFSQAVVPFASHPTTLDPRWIGLAAAIAHRLALSVWLGGLPALILLIGVGTIGEDTRHFAGAILRHFSRVATVAMLIILATGGILTWYLVGNLPGMIGTLYGNLLSIKLALLAGVLLIAKSLQSQLLPALEIKPSDSVFLSYARRVKVETLLAVLIVFIASDMAGLSPPAHEDIVWPLHFRFSIAATLGKGTPWWMWTLIGTGSVLMLVGPVLIALVSWPSSLPARFRPKQKSGPWSRCCRPCGGLRLGAATDLGACFSKYLPHDGHSLRRDVDCCRSQSFRTKLHGLPWCERPWRWTRGFELTHQAGRSFGTTHGFAHSRRPLLVDIPWHSGVGNAAF